MKRAESALQFISSVERDTWVSMGMALQSEFGDAARDIWMDWSREADSFKESDARAVWKSFKGTGVSIASLFHEAKQNGWRDDQAYQAPTAAQIQAKQQAAAERLTKEGQDRIKAARDAAKKADWILGQCKPEKHAYMQMKGFPDVEVLTWRPQDDVNLMCIPMYVNGKLCGVQMIDKHGDKKYLSGQSTAKAEYCIDSGALNASDWWVEGYASGLSLQACLHALKLRYRIHITFSAGNLKRMAHSGYVIADNDTSLTGQNAAMATALPYWLPPVEGTDINDFHQQHGTFRTSQILGKWLRELREERDFYSG
jgi:putative DNA primase/helicase